MNSVANGSNLLALLKKFVGCSFIAWDYEYLDSVEGKDQLLFRIGKISSFEVINDVGLKIHCDWIVTQGRGDHKWVLSESSDEVIKFGYLDYFEAERNIRDDGTFHLKNRRIFVTFRPRPYDDADKNRYLSGSL